MRISLLSRFVRLAFAFYLVAEARTARAEAPRACIDAVERGQSLRDKVKLTQAKASFLVCASSACPEIIQRDCAQWIAELETRIPTVIITASDPAGHDVVYVRVLVDGEPFADRLDGIAVPIDPGIHILRLEPMNGPPLEQTVVVREAEKYQKQHFTLPAQAPTAPVSPRISVTPPMVEHAVSGRANFGTGAIAGVSVAGVAAGFFTGFAIAGDVDVHDLGQSCSPRCQPSQVDGARRDFQIADVSLGVGVAALAVATWLYFEWRARPDAPPPGAALGNLVVSF
jgi:hypothetical protein